MPKSIEKILLHTDELTKVFEDFDPNKATEVDVNEYLLQRAALDRARCEKNVVDAVTAARQSGMSWQRIGEVLGISAQAAHQRYGELASNFE